MIAQHGAGINRHLGNGVVRMLETCAMTGIYASPDRLREEALSAPHIRLAVSAGCD